MIGQLKALHRIKSLKRDQALTALQLKRAQQREAEAAMEAAKAAVIESKRTLSSREDAIYDRVMGEVIDLGGLDELRGEVVKLEQAHEQLKDEQGRAEHINKRMLGEVDQAQTVFRAAEKVQEKYVILRDTLAAEIAAEAEYREDAEVEDLFSRPMRRIA